MDLEGFSCSDIKIPIHMVCMVWYGMYGMVSMHKNIKDESTPTPSWMTDRAPYNIVFLDYLVYLVYITTSSIYSIYSTGSI